jgi:four helix bundle protein
MRNEERGMKENIAREKSMLFAIRIVNLYKYLSKKKEFVMSKQVLKSGTSIGANLAEADCSISKKEFLAKTYIAFKECIETKYWLELLQKTDFINMTEYNSLAKDCDEIYKILASITKTTRNNMNNEN